MNPDLRNAMSSQTLEKLIPPVNVGDGERWISVLAGVGLIALGLNHRRLRGLMLPAGGALILRGITGRCSVNQALGRNTVPAEEEAEFDSPVASVHRGGGNSGRQDGDRVSPGGREIRRLCRSAVVLRMVLIRPTLADLAVTNLEEAKLYRQTTEYQHESTPV